MSSAGAERARSIERRPTHEVWGQGFAITGGILALLSVGLYLLNPHKYQPIHLGILASWVLGPPLWFILETYRLVEKDKRIDPHFRLAQELFSKLWLAASAFIGALASIFKY
jgi:hypothetical protein